MANIISSVIEFDNVSKAFRLHRDRTEPFWQLFVQRLRRNQQDLHQFNDSIFWALRDVSFTVPHGSTVGLIGANGAGKSTTLKLISRIIQPTSGSVKVKGRVTALLELGAGFHPELGSTTRQRGVSASGAKWGYD
jgi:lipopolysaccharide transport system ATP-binding protein